MSPITYSLRLPDMPLRDPFILVDQATQSYFLYAENDAALSGEGGSGVMVYQSKNLREWSSPAKVYSVPSDGWAAADGGAAAPEVHFYAGKYYLFVTLQNRGTILGVSQQGSMPYWQTQWARASVIAVADSPLGPFVDMDAAAPFTNPRFMTLDGTLYVEPDGTPWMVLARDWIQKIDATMEAVQLVEDLSGPAADPIWLFKGSSAPWYKDPVYGAPPGRALVNDLQGPPYATYGPQVYDTPSGALVMLWSSYRRHYTEYVQAQALSRTGNIAGPWELLDPIVTGNKGHGMIFEALDGQLMLILHNNHDIPQEARAELYDVAITDNGVEVLRHRGDLDGVA